MTTEEKFESCNEDFLKFDRIPENERRHPVPDICGFIYLHEKAPRPHNRLGKWSDIVCAAEHDEIHLDYDHDACMTLTLEDVRYLSRCGIRVDEYGLCMFV